MRKVAFYLMLLLPLLMMAQGSGSGFCWFKGGQVKFVRDTVAFKEMLSRDDNTQYEVRLGLEAGVGMSRIFSSNLSQPRRLNESAGFYINTTVDAVLFETGLKWHRRNYRLTGFLPSYAPGTSKLELNPQYLEIPVMVGPMFALLDAKRSDVRLALKLGMYFAVGIGGNGTYYGMGDLSKPTTIDDVFRRQSLYSDQLSFDPLKRFDIGGKFGADIYINRWKIGFEYTRGWKDLNGMYDRHLKTKSFDFTVGFTFGYKPPK